MKWSRWFLISNFPISNWNSFWMSNFFKFNLRCILFVVHITTFIFFPNVILLKLSHQSNDFFMQCICTYLWQCFNIKYGLQIQIEPIPHTQWMCLSSKVTCFIMETSNLLEKIVHLNYHDWKKKKTMKHT